MTEEDATGAGANPDSAKAPMPKSKHRRGDPYTVGFGKTPEHTRFKPGEKRAPRRKPNTPPVDRYQTFWKIMHMRVPALKQGVAHKVRIIDGLTDLLRRYAMAGHVGAAREFAFLLEKQPEPPEPPGESELETEASIAFFFRNFDAIQKEASRVRRKK